MRAECLCVVDGPRSPDGSDTPEFPFAEGPLSLSPADAAQQCTGWDRHSATIFTQLWFLISSYSGATDWENLETGPFLGRKCK